MAKVEQKAGPLGGVGQVVLVFQGGGALGAYQAGVYEALHEAGVGVDWVIGTSIGAINAGLIAGNAPEDRVPRLREFWQRVQYTSAMRSLASVPVFGPAMAAMGTVAAGLPNFFEPNPMAFFNQKMAMAPERAGYYSTRPLERTLAALIDLERANSGAPRLTVGAANVGTGEMRYFDSRKEPLDLRHLMASGALPPAFPAVRIDEDLYWDGGILSNTPTEAVFDDYPRRDSIVFAIHMWHPQGDEPHSIWDVANRQKDLQYANRALSQIERQRQLHRLRHVIAELSRRLPPDLAKDPEVQALRDYGCMTRMHVVRLLAPTLPNEDHTKDIDFSPKSVEQRWALGLADMREVLAQKPWTRPHDPIEGFILHELTRGPVMHEVK